MDTDYIERLRRAIYHLHQCRSDHLETVPVKEVFRGSIVWEGDVEVFSVKDHARAKKCYAWSVNRDTPDEKCTAILELPPVRSALDAVKVAILINYKTADKESDSSD